MTRNFLRITPITLFVLALMFAGKFSVNSDSSEHRNSRRVFDASYRSRSSKHKVIVQANEPELRDSILAEGGSIMEDYGAFVLMSSPGETADRVSTQSVSGSSVRDDLNVLLLRAGSFDTTEGEAVTATTLGEADTADEQLYLVQFIGPVKKQWVNELRNHAEIVSYIPNNAYLVRANAAALSDINSLGSNGRNHVQWTGAYRPAYKIAPEISLSSEQEITSTIQLVSTRNTDREIQDLLARSSASVVDAPATVLNYTNIRVKVDPRRLG